MDLDLQAIIESFVTESAEGLSSVEEALVALEANPADPEAIGTVFRVAHTIKGNAGSLGFPPVAEFAHVLEDVLDGLRKKSLAVSPQLVTLLLHSVDALRVMIPETVGGSAEMRPEHRALLKRVERVRKAPRPATAAPVKAGAGDDAPSTEAAPEPAPAAEPAYVHPLRRREDFERSLRVDIEKLDKMLDLTGEIAISRGRVRLLLEDLDGAGADALEAHRELDRLSTDLQELVMKARMVPLGPTFRHHLRTVRDVAADHGKQARLVIRGEDVEVDTTVIEHIRDPLTHMLRNAIGHGLERPEARRRAGKDPCGEVTLSAFREAGSIVIQIADDGAGLDRRKIAARAHAQGRGAEADALSDAELTRLIFEPGFSTAETVTDLSGRGVGLEVVARAVEALRGTVGVESREGQGTTVTLRLPLTLAIIAGFGVGVADETFVIPLDAVTECLELPAEDCPHLDGRGVANLRGETLPYLRLRDLFGMGGERPGREQIVVLRQVGGAVGLVVDHLYGETQTVIKPLGKLFRGLPGVAGSAILGNGRVALILDVPTLLREVSTNGHGPQEAGAAQSE
jgi:two-component system chemotaxis sensor kinase CheA